MCSFSISSHWCEVWCQAHCPANVHSLQMNISGTGSSLLGNIYLKKKILFLMSSLPKPATSNSKIHYIVEDKMSGIIKRVQVCYIISHNFLTGRSSILAEQMFIGTFRNMPRILCCLHCVTWNELKDAFIYCYFFTASLLVITPQIQNIYEIFKQKYKWNAVLRKKKLSYEC